MSYIEMMHNLKQQTEALKTQKPAEEAPKEVMIQKDEFITRPEPLSASEQQAEAVTDKETVVQATTEQREFSEDEKVAMRMGWKPKDQWKGKEDDWVEASVYVNSGPVFKRTEALKKSIEKLTSENEKNQELVKALVDDIRSAKERAYQEALRDLEAQKQVAIDLNDYKSVKTIEEQEQALRPMVPQSNVQQGPDLSAGSTKQFLEQNPHLDLVMNHKYDDPNYDKALAIHAFQTRVINEALAEKGNLSQEQQYEIATKAKLEKYGDNPFGESARKATPPPQMSVQSIPRQSNNSSSSKVLSPSALHPGERVIYNDLLVNGKARGMSPEEYLKICSSKREGK